MPTLGDCLGCDRLGPDLACREDGRVLPWTATWTGGWCPLDRWPQSAERRMVLAQVADEAATPDAGPAPAMAAPPDLSAAHTTWHDHE